MDRAKPKLYGVFGVRFHFEEVPKPAVRIDTAKIAAAQRACDTANAAACHHRVAKIHFLLQTVTFISAAAHYDYLAREGKYSVEYYGQDDLRVEQSGNMPAWAAKPEDFWNAADRFGKVNGRSYREINVALQNELSFEDNLQLVREFLKESRLYQPAQVYSPDHFRNGLPRTSCCLCFVSYFTR